MAAKKGTKKVAKNVASKKVAKKTMAKKVKQIARKHSKKAAAAVKKAVIAAARSASGKAKPAKKVGTKKTKATKTTKTSNASVASGDGMRVNVPARYKHLEVSWRGIRAPAASKLGAKATAATRGYILKKGAVWPSAGFAYKTFGLNNKHGSAIKGGKVQTRQIAMIKNKSYTLVTRKIKSKTFAVWAPRSASQDKIWGKVDHFDHVM